MEFRILGPLELLVDGRALQLAGRNQRALLAMLLMHANTVVSPDRLIEALWDGDAPETAQKALQVYVSQLRKLLGKERVGTHATGYVLHVAEGELDLAAFQRLADAGEYERALAMWRGRPLADFAYRDFAQTEIARLEEQRLACLEGRIEVDLARGRHADLVGELEALVTEHPLRERLRAQLMLALYRSGRQAEALEAYQETRRALTEELGIDPGRQLRELHQAVLNQDPALDLDVAPTAARPLSDLMPATVSEPAAHEMRKTVTVLFALVTTASRSGERLDPELLRHVNARAFAGIRATVNRHGGSVEESTGDSLTAVFGIPAVHEDDAARALRSAVDAVAALRELTDELERERGIALAFRVGVSTGQIVAGGGELRPLGEPMSAAPSLARRSAAGEVLLDEATHRLVRAAVSVEPLGDAYRLLEAEALGHRRTPFAAPMVGRVRERRRLHDAFEQAVADRSCQLFTVLGLAGVGKSRLVQEFLGDIPSRSRVARGRCLPYGEGITYWPLMEVVQHAAELEETRSPEEGLERLAALLDDEQDPETIARRVGELVGLAEVEAAVDADESFTAVRVLLESLARRAPLVIVFDDIHWAESTFLDLIESIADWIRDAPVLLVCVARPELLDARPSWGGGKLNATTVLLEPLSLEESSQLVESLAGDGLDEAVQQRIVTASEGNPLFVEEMLALALEEPGSELVVPPTIQALLAARLDRLSDEERLVVESAALQGKVFWEDAVSELSEPHRRPRVTSSLGALLHKELIRPHGPALGRRMYRFRHLLIRDAAYDSIPKEARADLHERFARWLERAAGERSAEYEEILGYHLEQAYRYRAELGLLDDHAAAVGREAADRLGAAGSRAFVRRDAEAAVTLMSRAVALLPPDDPSRVNLVPNVRVVQGLSGDLSWADRVLSEAVNAAAAGDDRQLAAHARVQRAILHLFTRPDVTVGELREVAEQAIAVFDEFEDELGLARAWRLLAQTNYLARRAGPSAEASERALEHARRAGDILEQREIIEWLCVALMLGPARAPDVTSRCEQLLVDVSGDPILEPTVLAVLGNVEAMQGRSERAHELLLRWRGAVEEYGESIWLFAINFGFVALATDPAAAERELRPGYEALRAIGEKSHFSSVAGLLARAMYGQGRYEEAETLTRESEHAARPNDVHSHILWRTTRAKVLAKKGELEAAEQLALEGVAFAAESDFLDSHGDVLIDLAEVLALAGRHDEAAAALEKARGLYSQKGNVVSATRAASLLTEAQEKRRTLPG